MIRRRLRAVLVLAFFSTASLSGFAAGPARAQSAAELEAREVELAAAAGRLEDARAALATQQQELSERQLELAQVRADLDAKMSNLVVTEQAVSAELARLVADIEQQDAALNEARDSATRATGALVLATGESARVASRLDDLRLAMRDRAVAAYMRPPIERVSALPLPSAEADAATRYAFLGSRFESDAVTRRDIEAATDALLSQRVETRAVATDAEAAKLTKQQRVLELAASWDEQAALLERVNDQLDSSLAEAAGLEQIDREVADKLRGQQVALAGTIADLSDALTQRAAIGVELDRREQDRLVRERQKAAQARYAKALGSFSNQAGPIRLLPLPTVEQMVSAEGYLVHPILAKNVAAMVQAARADGIDLGGWAYRDTASQVALRRAHCGPSDYAIWEMASHQCRPPTARPGRSMHEYGMAIDFNHNGVLIGTRESPAFIWLRDNASSYGFQNLPSEPWHWSINGD